MELNFLALVVNFPLLVNVLLAIVLFVIVGLIIFAGVYVILHLVVPFSMRKQLEIDENPALAVVIGSLLVAVSIIIGAAISS